MRKASLVLGMIAGSLVGAAATMIALPFMQPQINKIIRKGKNAAQAHFEKMDSNNYNS